MKAIHVVTVMGTLALLLALVPAAGGCAAEDCQVEGENCSQAYRDANGIDYDCCEGLSCTENALGDLVWCLSNDMSGCDGLGYQRLDR